MFLSRLFNGRLSPMNLSQPSSLATANAPEANLGSKEDGGNMQASLQRNILRTQARRCCWVTGKMRSRHVGILRIAKVVRRTGGRVIE